MRNVFHSEQQHPTVRLVRALSVDECVSRNALTTTTPGFSLSEGASGVVLETFDGGRAFLVEFGSRDSTACDWMGVLYAREVEFVSELAEAA